MPKLPGISYRRAVKAFEKAGFEIVRQSGHLVMKRDGVTIEIPRHNPINAYTMAAIVRQAGLTIEQFKALL
ncbi:MAG: type II toxin-antitoxin system HicA family toxin [Planctomycetota bacterium]